VTRRLRRLARGAPVTVLLLLVGAAPRPERGFDLQGHRGARGLAPENTLAAFRRALEVGVTTLELDVVVSRDGVPMVSHDLRLNPQLTRDADGEWVLPPGPAFLQLGLDEIRRFDVGRPRPGGATALRFPSQAPADGERIPTLAEVLALAPAPVRYNVETKLDPPDLAPDPRAFAEVVIRELRRAGVADRASLQSFDWRTLRRAARIAPEIERVCLTSLELEGGNLEPGRAGAPIALDGLDVDDYGGSVPRLVQAAGCAVWSPSHAGLDATGIGKAHALGLRVVTWTVNDEARMGQLIDLGVDGIITDYPDRLRRVMDDRDLPLPEPVLSVPAVR
jgi:glycerophosphoryl diester phosphodiesterase